MDAGPEHTVGVWFTDLPGCTSAGADIDDALLNSPEALELYAEAADDLPSPRTMRSILLSRGMMRNSDAVPGAHRRPRNDKITPTTTTKPTR
jgi:hypothetical protein